MPISLNILILKSNNKKINQNFQQTFDILYGYKSI